MKKYYLHIGTENSGPFDLEELKIKRITKKTPVWFEGLENWKYAEEIEELKSVFVVTPPPIHSFKNPQIVPITRDDVKERVKKKAPEEVKEEAREVRILGLTKNVFFLVLTFILLLIATLIFNSYQENRDRELEQKNHKTEVENHQYELQQKEIEEQKVAQAEQEKIEAERAVQMNKQSLGNRIIEIEKMLAINQSNLETAKERLKDASGFKFLRSVDEKAEQINELQKEIDSYLRAIEKLNSESNQLKLELEKIK